MKWINCTRSVKDSTPSASKFSFQPTTLASSLGSSHPSQGIQPHHPKMKKKTGKGKVPRRKTRQTDPPSGDSSHHSVSDQDVDDEVEISRHAHGGNHEQPSASNAGNIKFPKAFLMSFYKP